MSCHNLTWIDFWWCIYLTVLNWNIYYFHKVKSIQHEAKWSQKWVSTWQLWVTSNKAETLFEVSFLDINVISFTIWCYYCVRFRQQTNCTFTFNTGSALWGLLGRNWTLDLGWLVVLFAPCWMTLLEVKLDKGVFWINVVWCHLGFIILHITKLDLFRIQQNLSVENRQQFVKMFVQKTVTFFNCVLRNCWPVG